MNSLPLPIQQTLVLITTLAVMIGLFWEKLRPSALFLGAALLFVLTGIIPVKDLLGSFSNESVLSIFLLIFITSGIKEHFNLIGWLDRLFGKAKTGRGFLLRMSTGIAPISAIMNNTPIVALMIPYVYQWARKHKVAASKLLMPLSFATITSGMLTVVGTSTNLVLQGLIESKGGQGPGFMDYLLPGLLVTGAGILFLYFIGYHLLPSRADAMQEMQQQAREYLAETLVSGSSSLVGKTVSEARLRNLPGVYLFEIVRQKQVISPATPEEILQAGDRLFFAGDTENIMELIRTDNGLSLPQSNGYVAQTLLDVVETVIPGNSDMIGRTLKDIRFRENFDAAVIAIHRKGEKLSGKLGEIPLKAGDLLLISAGKNFIRYVDEKKNLYLVSLLAKAQQISPRRRWIFSFLFFLCIAGIISHVFTLFLGLLFITLSLVALRMLSVAEIKKNLDLDLLIILGASLTFSKALIDTGSAATVARIFMEWFHPWGAQGALVGIFLLTLVLTSFVTHVAAVSVAFPVAYAVCHSLGVSGTPFYVALAFAASASFHAPFSYQTNLMVYGPGNYRFKDFIKVGLPFTLLYSVICIGFILWRYPL